MNSEKREEPSTAERKAADSRRRADEMRGRAGELAGRAHEMRQQAEEARERARQGPVAEPGPDPSQRPSLTCPQCGQPFPAGAGCSLCGGASLAEGRREFTAAEETWEQAQVDRQAASDAHDRADDRASEAHADWARAQAAHSVAMKERDQAEAAWEESRQHGDQAAVDWEAAQTRWRRAQEVHAPEEPIDDAGDGSPSSST